MTRAGQPARDRVTPLSGESYALQCTLTREARELLEYAQALEGHTVPAGDLGTLLLRALRSHVDRLEKSRFAKRSRMAGATRGRRAVNPDSRHVPAHVRRTVWRRDGGRCTFVGTNGHRCEATCRLEYDHVTAYARGGEATVDGIRLVCRAHNQYEAERTFGRAFMDGRREAAKRRAAQARTNGDAHAPAVPAVPAPGLDDSSPEPAGNSPVTPVPAPGALRPEPLANSQPESASAAPAPTAEPAPPPQQQPERESLIPWLRSLGCRVGVAKQVAAIADARLPEGTLEQRLKLAVQQLRPAGVKVVPAPTASAFAPSPPAAPA